MKLFLLLSWRYVLRRRSFWLRGSICFAFGVGFLLLQSEDGYDLRFSLRTAQEVNDQIVLVTVSQREWVKLNDRSRRWPGPIRDRGEGQDSLYWNPKLWNKILQNIVEGRPKKIGVGFYFDELLYEERAIGFETPIFRDPRVFWSARKPTENQNIASHPFYQVMNLGFKPDSKGVVRFWNNSAHGSMAQRLTANTGLPATEETLAPRERTINFQSNQSGFNKISLIDVISGLYGPELFTDKIVLIGGEDAIDGGLMTPIGPLNRVTILANIIDNILGQKEIRHWSNFSYSLGLILLLLLASWIMSLYPQSVALVFFIGIGTIIAALSVWIFDTFYFWIPMRSPLLQLAVTYMVFLSYQLTVADYQNRMLEKERKNSTDVEELKNNFLSLISHDLKTPIAKIQAICDRVIVQNLDHEFASDLTSLRRESAELHKYIQTILQITRVESKNFKLRKDPSDINEIVQNVADQVTPLIELKGQNLAIELEPLFLVEIDSTLMHEVILNLVENALKYTPTMGKIHLSTKEVDDKIVFMVEDSGPGISTVDQGKIFDKFFRGPNVDNVGSGLGLYLVKYFIELHQGKILLESQTGKGTKIGFWVPISGQII